MGPLQPGLPSPAMLPRMWPLAGVDIKDCFFSIPLHPDNAPRFAFSVPSINRAKHMRRYHWQVLPQGMRNSLSICQWYVAGILSSVRKAFPKTIILHCIDDVLVCAPSDRELEQTLKAVLEAIEKRGMEIQPEKVQSTCP